MFIWIVQTVLKSTKVLITQPFFELQTPDFAWKFIWSVQPNGRVQKYKNTKTHKMQICKKWKNVENLKGQKVNNEIGRQLLVQKRKIE